MLPQILFLVLHMLATIPRLPLRQLGFRVWVAPWDGCGMPGLIRWQQQQWGIGADGGSWVPLAQ